MSRAYKTSQSEENKPTEVSPNEISNEVGNAVVNLLNRKVTAMLSLRL